MRLEDLHSPEELRALSGQELEELGAEIRRELISTVARRGGHLASNLGVVELTMALHRVFDIPRDKLIFDVGHQCYVHKLLTGRYMMFRSLRSFGGLSGFPKRSESEYDIFETGHASTAISAALGMARARDLRGEDHDVIAVVGDGSLTGGMCYEALNDAGSSRTPLIVILNDNEMSISPNVGGLSRHLTDLRISKGWNSTRRIVKSGLDRIPVVGPPIRRGIHRVTSWAKSLFVDEGFFTSLGFRYLGPFDGHNLRQLEKALRSVRHTREPVVLHVLTQKGHGYELAEEKPEQFHGTPPFYVETGDPRSAGKLPVCGEVMAQELCRLAEKDARIVGITAAMASGTGLALFQEKYPERFLDVGITEEHAVTMAAGLAAGGMKPYFAVYASFFQRAYDQLIHDVAMQGLPVTFLLDRSGIVGEDGATHHGVLDLAETIPVPGLTILAPRDTGELRQMIRWSASAKTPVVIRYGKSLPDLQAAYPSSGFTPGRWETLEKGEDCALLAVGSMVETALATRAELGKRGIRAGVVSCATVKPLDREILKRLDGTPVFTMEEHMLTGGFGSAVQSLCADEGWTPPVGCFGVQDTFVQHGRRDQLLKYIGLEPVQMAARIAAEMAQRSTD